MIDILDIVIENLPPNYADLKTLSMENLLDEFQKEHNEDMLELYNLSGYPTILKNRDYRAGFVPRLLFSYSESFYLLEIFLERCIQLLIDFEQKNKSQDISHRPSFQALHRLNGRCILIANEILCLLKNGFPSGALARWRSLFETSTFAMLIATAGDSLAERYLDYIDIETYYEAKILKESKAGIDSEYSKIDLTTLEKRKNELEKKYGRAFSKENGWAHDFLKLKKGKKSTLKEMLIRLEQTDMYPYYKFSNIPLHAGPKNLFYDLAKINGVDFKLMLLGPSNIGFTEPAQLTAFGLYNVLGALLALRPEENDVRELLFLRTQITQIGKSFLEAHEKIMKEESKDF